MAHILGLQESDQLLVGRVSKVPVQPCDGSLGSLSIFILKSGHHTTLLPYFLVRIWWIWRRVRHLIVHLRGQDDVVLASVDLVRGEVSLMRIMIAEDVDNRLAQHAAEDSLVFS